MRILKAEASGKQLILNFPYVADKSKWPYALDIAHFDAFPSRVSFMLFAGWE